MLILGHCSSFLFNLNFRSHRPACKTYQAITGVGGLQGDMGGCRGIWGTWGVADDATGGRGGRGGRVDWSSEG